MLNLDKFVTCTLSNKQKPYNRLKLDGFLSIKQGLQGIVLLCIQLNLIPYTMLRSHTYKFFILIPVFQCVVVDKVNNFYG